MWNSIPVLQAVASGALVITLIAGILAAGAGAVGTWASNRAADLEKMRSDQMVSAANAKAAEANARAHEAALETQKIRSEVAWRRITPEQQAALATALQGFHSSVVLETVKTDSEAVLYWDELSEALRAAGVPVKNWYGSWMKVTGLHVNGEDGPELRRLVAALKQSGVKVDMVTHKKPNYAQFLIIVGTKTAGWDLALKGP